MDWKKLLAYISGSVDEDLLLRNEYLVTENRILRAQIKGRLRLTDSERKTLAEIGKKLGKQVLGEVASIVKPETILAWHRRLVAKKFDGSKNRTYPGRPKIDAEVEDLIIRLAKENRSWGYDRIVGALGSLSYKVTSPSAMSSNATASLRPLSAKRRLPGGSSFARTWTSWLQRIFLPRRFGRRADS